MKHILIAILLVFSNQLIAQEGWYELDTPISGNLYGALYPIDENLVHAVTDNGVFHKTLDGGETWTTFDAGVEGFFLDLVFYNQSLGIAVGSEGALLKTDDGGETWNSINSGTSNDLFSVAFTSPSEIWVVGANGTILHSVNSGDHWTLDNSLTEENLYSIRFKDENTGLMAGANGTLFQTANGGADWVDSTLDTSLDLFSISIIENFFRIMTGEVIENFEPYLSFQGFAYYETDDLLIWEEKYLYEYEPEGASGLFYYSDTIGFSLWAQACLCDVCYLNISKTNDGGNSWEYSLKIQTDANNCIYNWIEYSDIKFISEEVGYVLYGNKIFKTTDGGTYTVLDLETFDKATSIQLFPNPSQDILNVLLEETTVLGGEIVIRNVFGQKMHAFPIEQNKTIVDVSTFQTGMYFLQVVENGKVLETKKFIKY